MAQAAAPDEDRASSILLDEDQARKQRLQEILTELELLEKELLQAQADLPGWLEETKEVTQRAKRLAKEKAEAAADQARTKALGILETLTNSRLESLGLMTETFRQEQSDLQEALKLARALLVTEEKAKAQEGTVLLGRSLDDLVRHMEELRLAGVSLSLLKARRAGLKEELDQKLKQQTKAQAATPTQLPEAPEGRADLQAVRSEYEKSWQQNQDRRRELRGHIQRQNTLQLNFLRLQILQQEAQIRHLDLTKKRLMEALQVTDPEVTEARTALLNQDDSPREKEREINKEIRRLRTNPLPPDEEGLSEHWDQKKRLMLRLNILQHRLYVLDLEEQLRRFRAASVVALDRLVDGQAPDPAYFADYGRFLDADKQEAARQELKARREAWRQEYAFLQTQTEGVKKKVQTEVFGLYLGMLDLYDQMDSHKWQMEWVAQTVRHYQTRWELAQRGPAWYAWRVGASLIIFLAALFLSLMLGKATLRPIKARPDAPRWLRNLMFQVFAAGLLLLWAAAIAATFTNIWGTVLGFDGITTVFSATLFTIGDSAVSLLRIAQLLGIIVLTVLVNRLLLRFISRWIFPYFNWDLGVQHAFLAVLKYLVFFAGVALGLELVGIGLGALTLFAGVVGIGIGFGLQTIANNFISGLIILFERPIKKGDFVDAGGLQGKVEEIHARATTIVTRDQVSVIVPNSEFMSGKVINWSHGSELVRIHVPVGVAYGSDVKQVVGILTAAGQAEEMVLKDPPPKVWFAAFGDSSLNFELLVWTRHVEGQREIISRLNYAIDEAFRREGVEIPFPQRDLHIKSLPEGFTKS
jgi:small-conductance mechanosensitive channel